MVYPRLFIFAILIGCAASASYGYALAAGRQSLPYRSRALVARQADFTADSSSQQVESSGIDFHPAGFPATHPKSSDISFEKSFSPLTKESEQPALPDIFDKPNFLKPLKTKPVCPFLNPWLDAVAHPDSDPECGHGMPGWRAHPSCRCHFLVKDRDEFGCALKFFTRCMLNNFAVVDTEDQPREAPTTTTTTTTEEPTTRQVFSTVQFRPTTKPRIVITPKQTFKPVHVTTTRRPVTTTTRRTTTHRPATAQEQFEEEFTDSEDDEEQQTGPGFDYIMGTRIIPDEKNDQGNGEVSLPQEFGQKESEEEPQFLVGRRIRLRRA
ncbi:unnamed protein product, partial [Mesorhabditis spiculigera]